MRTLSKLPAPGTDPYNYPRHSGVDVLRGPSHNGKPFYASGPGVVLRLSKNASGGNWIVIKYDALSFPVGYAHMNSHAGCPKPGTRVGLGSLLGYVGSTGTRVTGPHLHMEAIGIATPAAILNAFDFTRAVNAGTTKRHVTVDRSVKAIQEVVGAKPDNVWGPETEAKVKAFQSKHGLKADGIWGPASDKAGFPPKPSGNANIKTVQTSLNAIGYKLVVDGISGPATRTALKDFQKRNGLKADGIWGPNTQTKFNQVLAKTRPVLRRSSRGAIVKVLQKKLGINADGIFGPNTDTTVRAYQKKHGLTVDGIVGYQTWLKLGL